MNKAETPPADRIKHLSPPAPVSMADDWYQIADLNHFWIRRRWEVLKKLAGTWMKQAESIGEIGCGNGILQAQIELDYQRQVDGFELNESSLKVSLSKFSPLIVYDILSRQPGVENRYDFLLLCDVLEHIENEREFLEAVCFMLKPGGRLLVHVPAIPGLFSKYDQQAGHQRRYTHRILLDSASETPLQMDAWTSWGPVMIPLLWIRKRMLSQTPPEKVIHAGFKPPSPVMNELLFHLSRIGCVPGKGPGTSIAALFRKPF